MIHSSFKESHHFLGCQGVVFIFTHWRSFRCSELPSFQRCQSFLFCFAGLLKKWIKIRFKARHSNQSFLSSKKSNQLRPTQLPTRSPVISSAPGVWEESWFLNPKMYFLTWLVWLGYTSKLKMNSKKTWSGHRGCNSNKKHSSSTKLEEVISRGHVLEAMARYVAVMCGAWGIWKSGVKNRICFCNRCQAQNEGHSTLFS